MSDPPVILTVSKENKNLDKKKKGVPNELTI
jgi:hypothetical protein